MSLCLNEICQLEVEAEEHEEKGKMRGTERENIPLVRITDVLQTENTALNYPGKNGFVIDFEWL